MVGEYYQGSKELTPKLLYLLKPSNFANAKIQQDLISLIQFTLKEDLLAQRTQPLPLGANMYHSV